ncbi:TPA: hypothetical protein ACN97Y_002301, partial [Acinetobacter baumannii]|nr:hypothetical protein [Acinetobacter baumannii]
MLKKSLHDQIKIIGFWTVGGVFWYLVIAFFLKSKYPIFDYSFNLEIAYDVIKDALTLAASFLAPVAAFVLFSDWRVQHKALKNEKLSEDILRILNTELLSFYNFNPRSKSDVEDFNNHQMQFHRNVANIYVMLDEIDANEVQANHFIENIKKIEVDLDGLYMSIFKQIEIVIEHDAISDFLDTHSMRKKEILLKKLK